MYTHLMSCNTGSIASVLKIRFRSDRSDFEFDNDTIKGYFTYLLIDLLTYKPLTSFWISPKTAKNRVSNPMKAFRMLSVQLLIVIMCILTFIDY